MCCILFINHKIIGQTIFNASRELMKKGTVELLAVLCGISGKNANKNDWSYTCSSKNIARL